MACTDAVETEIDRHYGAATAGAWRRAIPELAADIADFPAEELEHRDTAREAWRRPKPSAYPHADCGDPGRLPVSNRPVETHMTGT